MHAILAKINKSLVLGYFSYFFHILTAFFHILSAKWPHLKFQIKSTFGTTMFSNFLFNKS